MAEWSIAVVERARAMDHNIDDDLGPPTLSKKKGTNKGKAVGTVNLEDAVAPPVLTKQGTIRVAKASLVASTDA